MKTRRLPRPKTPPPLRSVTLFRRLAMRLMVEAAGRGRERRKREG